MPAVRPDRRRLLAAATLLAAALAAVLLAATPAGAHAVLTGTTPERGATVTERLDVVVLEFSEGVAFPQVQVTGPDGRRVEEGLPVERGEAVEQPLPAVLEEGVYTVAFRVTSDDGHPVEGEFEFVYAGPEADDQPPPGAAGTGETGDEGDEAAAAGEAAAASDASVNGTVLVVVLLALLGFAGVAVVAVRRRGEGDPPPGGAGPADQAA